MGEALSFRRKSIGRCNMRRNLCAVDIDIGIRCPNSIAVYNILYRDTFRTFGCSMPFTVQIQLVRDPVAVVVLILIICGALAELVHHIRHINIPIIGSGDGGIVQNECLRAERSVAFRIKEPSIEIISVSGTQRNVNLIAGGDTEVHLLRCGTPVQRVVV